MRSKFFISALLILPLMLMGCSSSNDIKDSINDNSSTSNSQNSSQNPADEKENEGMKNIEHGSVPNSYYKKSTNQGTLETFTYQTKDYVGNGNAIQSQATIYLPYATIKRIQLQNIKCIYLLRLSRNGTSQCQDLL